MRFYDQDRPFDDQEGPYNPYPDQATPPYNPPVPPPTPVIPGTTDVPAPPDVETDPPDYGTFEMPSYSGPGKPSFSFPTPPQFRYTRFNQPSFGDAQNEPGYQFRLSSGNQALESSAAARGVLRTGGTLKDLVEYGQNFAAQEYDKVFNRALQMYGAQYQGERDAFAPLFADYQNRFGAEQASGLSAFDRAWDSHALAVSAALQRERLIADASLGS